MAWLKYPCVELRKEPVCELPSHLHTVRYTGTLRQRERERLNQLHRERVRMRIGIVDMNMRGGDWRVKDRVNGKKDKQGGRIGMVEIW